MTRTHDSHIEINPPIPSGRVPQPAYRDLAAVEQFAGTAEQRIREARRLQHVSPHAPLSIATQIARNWLAVEKNAFEWEKTYSDEPVVLNALSNRYWQLARWADAERCLKAEIKAGPEVRTYERLASLYQKQGNREAWRATLETFLKQEEEVGLEQALPLRTSTTTCDRVR